MAVILGSGLGEFASQLTISGRVAADKIDGYPRSTVSGHAGALYFGRISAAPRISPPLVIFQGRVHYYESGDISTAVAPIRLAYALGVRSVLITNAAGGIDQSFQPGNLMLIDDVLTLNPASGPAPTTDSTEIPRRAFDAELQTILVDSAHETKVPMRRGIYAWVHGPSYETAAEIRMLRAIGASAVGMSTVPEIVEANRLGLRVAGVSLISNMGTGISDTKLTHDEVTATAREASHRFTALLRHALLRFPQ
ncbi:MAG: purine-nucleoside phosphorylase [Bacteroidetes bacterium]|nr:purine-nucleoside phosphorylase [Bacteroidota bacterium]